MHKGTALHLVVDRDRDRDIHITTEIDVGIHTSCENGHGKQELRRKPGLLASP